MYPIWDEMFMDFKWFDEKEPQPRYKISADKNIFDISGLANVMLSM